MRIDLRINRVQLAFAHDLVVAGLSVGAAMYLRLGGRLFEDPYWTGLLYGTPVFVAICAVTFRACGLYQGVWRYASLPDLLTIAKAATLAILVFILAMLLLTRLDPVPRSMPAIHWLVLVFMLGGPRLAYRLFRLRGLGPLAGFDERNRAAVLLVGAGDAAELFIRSTTADRDAAYRVVGILDGRGRRAGQAIHGVPVLGPPAELARLLAGLARRGIHPGQIIVTDPALAGGGAGIRALVARAEAAGLTVSRLPSLTEFKGAVQDGRVELRPIALEDLLARRQTCPDAAALAGLIAGRRVLITGAGGSIGGELTRQIAALRPAALTLVDNGEFNLYAIALTLDEQAPGLPRRAVLCDVRDRDRVMRLCAQARPELVFHAAALKHVPMVELNPAQGVLTNAIGSRNVADAARAAGALALVRISTVKAVDPAGILGATARLADRYAQALDLAGDGTPGSTRFLTVRLGNVLESSGSAIPLFQRQIARGGPLTVTDPDARRYFMTTGEAVELVLHAAADGLDRPGERGRVVVLDMGEPIRVLDLARQLVRLNGLRPEIDVPIVVTGLRPGEKAGEALLDAGETAMVAGAAGTLVARSRPAGTAQPAGAAQPIGLAMLQRGLDELAAAARRGDEATLRRLIAHFVPDIAPAAPAKPESERRTS